MIREPAPFLLDGLPGEAVDLIARYASKPSTPSVCLLSAACRCWRAAAGRVSGLDICLDLAAGYEAHEGALERLQGTSWWEAPEATIAAATPPALKARRQLADWLTTNRQRLSSFCIPEAYAKVARPSYGLNPVWMQDLVRIRDVLTGQQQAPPSSITMPTRLVQLELPVLDLPGTTTFLKALRGCPSLQQLKLVPYAQTPLPWSFRQTEEQVSLSALGETLASMKQLKTLHLVWPYPVEYGELGVCLTGLLRSLPPTLADLRLQEFEEFGSSIPQDISIPLSCFTHLVNLRQWEIPAVGEVEDDSSSSSSSSSRNRSAHPCVASWTGMTELRVLGRHVRSVEARLHLPNLRSVLMGGAEPGAWQQLRGAQHLEQMEIYIPGSLAETMPELGQLARLRRLMLHLGIGAYPDVEEPLCTNVGRLVLLSELHVEDWVLLGAGPAMLAPLTQVTKLTVECSYPLGQEDLQQGIAAWRIRPAVSVVQAVAEAVARGCSMLQVLVLKGSASAVGEVVQEQVAAAAAEGLSTLKLVHEVVRKWWEP